MSLCSRILVSGWRRLQSSSAARALIHNESQLNSTYSHQYPPPPLKMAPFSLRRLYPFPTYSSIKEAARDRLQRRQDFPLRPPPQAQDPNRPPGSFPYGPALILHQQVCFLIRAADVDTANAFASGALLTETRPSVFTCNAIMEAMYAAKRYDDVVKLFDFYFNKHIIVPNIISQNILIKTHCDEGRVDLALEIYKHLSPFTPPSPNTYRYLTKGLSDVGRMDEALHLLREMRKSSIPDTGTTDEHLREFFNQPCHGGADSLVYNNVISGFLKLGNLDTANEFFHELAEQQYDGLLIATYMDWWFNQGKEQEAMDSYKQVFDDRKCKMTQAATNILLQTLLKHGRKREAVELFHHMLDNDNHAKPDTWAVNSQTFNIMVDECFKSGNLSEAISTFTKVASKPFLMGITGYNNIITRFCQHGLLDEAEKVFNMLLSSYKTPSPDCQTYRTLIDAFLETERIDDALIMLNKMVDANLRVVANFGTRVFEELIKKGKTYECQQLMSKMGLKDPLPDREIYEIVARELCTAGEFNKAQHIIFQMLQYHGGVTPSMVESVREAFAEGSALRDVILSHRI